MSELQLVQIGLREALADAQEAAKGVAVAVGILTHIYPATLDVINAMTENEKLATDALFYRYGGLVSLIQDKLFRAVADIEQEDRPGATRREITELMQKLHVIASARRFTEAAILRNKLSHGYPRASSSKAERFNEVMERSASLVQAYNEALTYVQKHELLPPEVLVELQAVLVPTLPILTENDGSDGAGGGAGGGP